MRTPAPETLASSGIEVAVLDLRSLAAKIQEEVFECLDAPVRVVGARLPLPVHLPGAEKVALEGKVTVRFSACFPSYV